MYLGIDIGGTRLKAALVDADGRILRSGAALTPSSRGAMRESVHALAQEVLGETLPAAIGFGCKGIIDAKTTEVRTLPGVWNFLEGALLKDIAPGSVPVAADNDAKAALAGEVVWGAARGRKNALLLTLGTGIGGAVLADGVILRGAADVAGHLGHVNATPDGPLCYCGNHGCLEAVFSSRAIESDMWTAVHQGIVSPLADAIRAEPEKLSCEQIFHYASNGDPVAKLVVDRKVRIFGAALGGLLHALDPEVVILTGSISEAGPALLEPLQREIDWRTKGLLKRSVPLLRSGVNDPSGVVGAAALAHLAVSRA